MNEWQRTDSLKKLQAQGNFTELKKLLDFCKVLRIFVPNLANISRPFSDKDKKYYLFNLGLNQKACEATTAWVRFELFLVQFKLWAERERAFRRRGSLLSNTWSPIGKITFPPIVRLRYVKGQKASHTDTCDFQVSSVLLQEQRDKTTSLIGHCTRSRAGPERVYGTTKRDCLAIE